MFAYCNNNPVAYIDPSGCRPVWEHRYSNGLIAYTDTGSGRPIEDITQKLNHAMQENAAILSDYNNTHSFLTTGLFFANKVRPGGLWDFKAQKEWGLAWSQLYLYDGVLLRYDDVGNIHYGYVGRAAFSEKLLLKVAGGVQILTDTSSWDYWKSNFDDPHDQWAVSFGCALWDGGN